MVIMRCYLDALFLALLSLVRKSSVTTSALVVSQNSVSRLTSSRLSLVCYASGEKNWVDGRERDDELPYRTRFAGDSEEARELQDMRYDEPEAAVSSNLEIVKEDYYYYDDDDDVEDEEGDEYMEEDFTVATQTVDEADDESVGNFWSNPKPGFDPLPSERRQASIDREKDTEPMSVLESKSQRRPRSRRRGAPRSKRTTFRSGSPSTPEPIADFYDRLFWYGFDPDESIAPGDKTLFGGTKGKFNGLDILQDDERRKSLPPSRQPRKRPPQSFRADEWYDDMMQSIDKESDEDDDAYEEVALSSERSYSRRKRPLPPKEEDAYYEESGNGSRSRSSYLKRDRPSVRRRNNDWVANEVSSWFSDDDTYDDEAEFEDDYTYGRSRRERRRAKEEESWSFISILDGIFRVDREQVDMNAASYNRQMGIDKPDRPRRRLDRRGRSPGSASPYKREEESLYERPSHRGVDIDVDDVVDVDAVIEDEVKSETPRKTRERTIDERAAAFERVPPSGVPAWGPSGEVGMDARTKATLDALEDIREATRKVERKEEQCIDAKEHLVVLKADFELQKKRLLATIKDPREVRSRLRQMKTGVQDAAHDLRRSRAELEVARDRLAELEDRNWALLSLYDADKAFQEVVETFREFEESEGLQTRLEDFEQGATDSVYSAETGRSDSDIDPDEGESSGIQ